MGIKQNLVEVVKLMNRNMWNLAFFNFDKRVIDAHCQTKDLNYRFMKYYDSNRWFADPQILDVTDSTIEVLVEELEYSRIGKGGGRIAHLTIDRFTMQLLDMKIVLELDTHLSFPFIYRHNNKVLVLPENSESGMSTIYEFKEEKLIPIKIICHSPLTDATIAEIDGYSYMLSTEIPQANGNVLQIRYWDANKLEASDVIQEIKFPQNHARNAGEVFSMDRKWYRPAQDCQKSYGHGTIIQEISIDKTGMFQFAQVTSFYPDSFKYYNGLHTMNHYKGIGVIDMLGKRNPIIARIISAIR